MENGFVLPNYTTSECSDGPKSGAIILKEFVIRWNYNGEGKIELSLNDENDELIQNIKHLKKK